MLVLDDQSRLIASSQFASYSDREESVKSYIAIAITARPCSYMNEYYSYSYSSICFMGAT